MPKPHTVRALAIGGVLLAKLGTPPALPAHDFWLEPSSLHPAPGETVSVVLEVGQKFAGEPLGRRPFLIDRFAWIDAKSERPIPGEEDASPAGAIAAGAPGAAWIVYQSNFSPVTLAPDKFASYLHDEGLEAILALRQKRGEADQPALEGFARSAKAIVCVGGRGTPAPARAIGTAIELVPGADLCGARSKERVPFTLAFRGQPLAGALVVAFRKEDPEHRLEAKSDRAGRLTLRFDQPGLWLVKAVHMIEAPAGVREHWRSFWASVVFELRK